MTVGSFSVLIPCLLLNLAPVHSPAITINNPSPAAVGFGQSIDSAEGLLTVGAPFETPNRDPGAGRVYLFNLETRSLTGTLVSPSAQFMGEFGERTYISDDRVIVSAPGEDVVGRAYVFSTATGALVST